MKRTKEKDDARNGWYEITPTSAAEMLGNGVVKNRALSELNARKIAETISQGRWTDTGETIILDHNGRLADGQHRLRACVVANKPISSMVVFMPSRLGVGFFDGIDQGKMRSAADRLGMDGVKHAALAASVSRLIIAHDAGTRSFVSNGRHDAAWVRKVYEDNSASIDSAMEFCQEYLRDVAGWLPASVLVYCHMQASAVNKSKAEEWTESVATSANCGRTSPILKARKTLGAEAGNSRTMKRSRRAVIGILAKSWLYFLSGETPKKLEFRNEEEVPSFDPTTIKKAAKSYGPR